MAGEGRLAAVFAKGVQGHVQGTMDRAAYQRKVAEDNLARNQANAQNTPENIQQQMEVLKATNEKLLADDARRKTYDAFKAYDADSDPRHLSVLMRDPVLKDIYGMAVSVDKIDPNNDAMLMVNSGFDPEMFQDPSINKDAFFHRYLKLTLQDGSKKLVDMQKLFVATGYADQLTAQELDQMLTRAKIHNLLSGKEGTPSGIEKKTEYLGNMGVEGGDKKKIANNLYRQEIAGVTPGKVEAANQAEDAMMQTFGGADKFYNTDFSKESNRRIAHRYIRSIEANSGIKFSPKDREDLKSIRQLLVSGATVANKLTPEATGWIDNFTSNVWKYLENEPTIDKTEARAAYNAYRNALLRSFGGTAMSDSEVANFDKAFGTLSQKYPAVISQFKQAIQQTKATLETIAQVNDPVLAHYYVGDSLEKVDSIIYRLDEDMKRINELAIKRTPTSETSDWRKDWERK